MIKKIVFSLFIGILFTIWHEQSSPWVKNWLEKNIFQWCSNSLICSLSAQLTGVNFFFPKFEFENVSIEALQGYRWKASAQKLSIGWSWLSLIRSGTIDLDVVVAQASCQTSIKNGSLAIMDYWQMLCAGDPLPFPIFLRSVRFTNTLFAIKDKAQRIEGHLVFTGEGKRLHNLFRIHASLFQGVLVHQEWPLIQNLAGEILADLLPSSTETIGTGEAKGDLCLFDATEKEQHCFYQVCWKNGQGTLSLFNEDKSLLVNRCTIHQRASSYLVNAHLKMPLAFGAYFMKIPEYDQITGETDFQLLLNLSAGFHTMHGQVACTNVAYKNFFIDRIQSSFCKQGPLWKGGVQGTIASEYSFSGSWIHHVIDGSGRLALSNDSVLKNSFFKQWSLQPEDLLVTCKWNPLGVRGKYQAIVSRIVSAQQVSLSGNFCSSDSLLVMQGMLGSCHYKGEIEMYPQLGLKELSYESPNFAKKLIFLKRSEKEKNRLDGYVSCVLLQEVSNNLFNSTITADGVVSLSFLYTANGKGAFNCRLINGTIRHSSLYNAIRKAQARIFVDFYEKKISIHNVHIGLHRGFFHAEHILCSLTSQGRISFIHMPFDISSCLFNLKKDLFALISGSFLYTQTAAGKSCIQGAAFIEQARLERDIFSDFSHEDVSYSTHSPWQRSEPLLLDLLIDTKNPITIQMPLLQAESRAHLVIQGTLADPRITGLITAAHGVIQFPYKPLYITKGNITFSAENNTPFFEISAQNNIRNYRVMLHMTGTKDSPKIEFVCDPSLTQEQCIALLCTGTPEESLSIVMPTLIMNNMKDFLWGNKQFPISHNYITTLLAPLRRIHFVPRFSNQANIQGVQGAFEIELSERWRAFVQHSFNFSDSTRGELEYYMSDNVLIRGFKDEKSQVGAEVEIRWQG